MFFLVVICTSEDVIRHPCLGHATNHEKNMGAAIAAPLQKMLVAFTKMAPNEVKKIKRKLWPQNSPLGSTTRYPQSSTLNGFTDGI